MIKIIIMLFGLGLLVPIQAQAGELEEWNDSCRNTGYEHGLNGPFSVETWDHCDDEKGGGNSYYHGFIDGCMDADNTKETCEMAIE